MIFTNWYAFSSIEDGPVDKRHYPDLCCKHREFFFLWYLYMRRWVRQPDEPFADSIYICDSGSPLSVKSMLDELRIDYQLLKPGEFDLDPSVRVHVKEYPNELNHFHGSSRVTLDYLKCCYHNDLDYFVIETDALVAYDICADYAGFDCYAQQFGHNNSPTIYQGSICFIDKRMLNLARRRGMMERYLHADTNTLDFHESQLLTMFGYGTRKDMDPYQNESGYGQDPARPYVHKTTPDLLLRFLREHPIDHPYVHRYVQYLVDKVPQSV